MLQVLLKTPKHLAPLRACILIGGASTRMGTPKHLLEFAGATQIERLIQTIRPFVRQVYISGRGRVPKSLSCVPRLPDPPGVRGPIAGLDAAFSTHPRSAWLLCACDMPRIDQPAIEWLISQRAPGVIAVIPRTTGGQVEPLLAVYESNARKFVRSLAEMSAGPHRIAALRSARTPSIPLRLQAAWTNINTPSDAAKVARIRQR
ncbi:MAG: molybdenum cofactor guanylyltransferase [Planctomycetes bacterium]|nr:molybdenum cofactor guanylyltransferase [Planctomycetota bacterium]